ncbi:MAG: ribosomal protein L24p/L26e, archaeal/eukaryotic [uncultured Acidilobus sp. CIS]|nr:MAG: ribosomal protein L24p/L26e, archaeal/eukaryotic [uncultured Acidilobus sp. CIS]NAZ39297.1 50S ribosomal protein L24 [Acidilobus sp.]
MASPKPKVQRKAFYNAPLHLRHKLASAHLSKELRDKLGIRSLPVIVGDKVMIMKGEHKGKTGKVAEVDLKGLWVKVEGITRKKADGTEVLVKFRPWNLLILDLNLKDERRRRIIERRGGRVEALQTQQQGAQQEGGK